MRPPLRPLLPILAAGAVLAGCGGSDGPSKAETFKSDYAAQRTKLNTISDEIGTALTGADGKTDAQVTGEIAAVEKRYSAQLDELDKLEPPKEREADFGTVTKAARTLDADLVAIVKAASGSDAATAKSATEKLVADIPPLSTASKKLAQEIGLPKSDG